MDERDYYYYGRQDVGMRYDSGDYSRDNRSRLARFFGGDRESRPSRRDNSYNSGTGTVIYTPYTYEDVQLLIDHLRMREQVIVDFSNVNQTSVYRILDFMSGAIYALNGSIQQIAKNIFLFAPSGVTISVPPNLGRR